MGTDSEGNIWVGLHAAGKLLRIDYKNPQDMKIYTPPSDFAGVYSVQGSSSNRLIWFSEQHVDKIARFDPDARNFVEYPLMSAESDVRKIEIDPTNPNRIWWSGYTSNKMGYIEIIR
jgi:streptogramin lyase